MTNEEQDHIKLGYLWGMLSSKALLKSRGRSPYIQISNTDKNALSILSEFGGSIYGPYRGTYRWIISGRDLRALIDHLDYWLPNNGQSSVYKSWRNKFFE